jgi:hypothetical protein
MGDRIRLALSAAYVSSTSAVLLAVVATLLLVWTAYCYVREWQLGRLAAGNLGTLSVPTPAALMVRYCRRYPGSMIDLASWLRSLGRLGWVINSACGHQKQEERALTTILGL